MISALLIFVSMAQSEPHHLQPITVRAKRPYFGVNSQTTNSAVVSSQTIEEHQYRQLNDALAMIPSLMVVTTGHVGQQTSVFSRGLSSNQLQVRVDGMRANSPDETTGVFDFDNFTTTAVSSLKVNRGVLSSFYGTNSLGGIIEINTKTGEGNYKQSALAEAGSFNTLRAQAGLHGEQNNTHLCVFGGRTQTRGYRQTPDKYKIPGTYYPKLPYQLNNLVANGGYRNDKVDITLYNRVLEAASKYQGMSKAIDMERRQLIHRLELTTKDNPSWQQRFGAGAELGQRISNPGLPAQIRNSGDRFQVDWQHHVTINDSQRLFGLIEAAKDHLKISSPGYRTNNTQMQAATALYYQLKLQKLIVEGAVRFEYHNKFDVPITGGGGLAYYITPENKVFLNIATSYRSPTLYELFGRNPYFTGNPHLQPERGRSNEIGLQQQLSTNLFLTTTTFFYSIKRLIETTPDFKSFANHASFKSRGIESLLAWQITDLLKLEGGYCYTQTQDYRGVSLLRRPKHKGTLRATFSKENWLIAADVLLIGKRHDFDPSSGGRGIAPAYMTVGVKAGYTLNKNWQLMTRIDNLFNKRAEDPLSFRKSGFAVYAGLNCQL